MNKQVIKTEDGHKTVWSNSVPDSVEVTGPYFYFSSVGGYSVAGYDENGCTVVVDNFTTSAALTDARAACKRMNAAAEQARAALDSIFDETIAALEELYLETF